MAEGGLLEGAFGGEAEDRQSDIRLPGADPAAVALAMDAARHDPELSRKAGDYLDQQGRLAERQQRLVDLQLEHFHEERSLSSQAARRKRFSDRLRNALQAFVAVIASVGALGVVGMVWAAAHDHGLVVEAFSVPPDLAQRGLTGQVVAKQVLDRLSDMQGQTESARAASSYGNNWGDDLKVEIPQTGVSLGELGRYLRGWLGHETRISGEVWRTPAGLTITARVGDGAAKSFSGADVDFERLVRQAAEAVYARTQPYRYSQYLVASGRISEAPAVLSTLARDPDRLERAWAHYGLGTLDLELRGDAAADAREQRAALSELPAFPLRRRSDPRGIHPRARSGGVGAANRFLAASRSRSLDIAPERMDTSEAVVRLDRALIEGDAAEAIRQTPHFLRAYRSSFLKFQMKFPLSDVAYASALGHDVSSLHRAAGMLGRQNPYVQLADALVALDAGDASSVVLLGQLADSLPGMRLDYPDPFLPRTVACWLAIAKSRFGDPMGARALIETTPTDCCLCVRARGILAAAAGERREAERWFAEAIRQAPKLPQAYVDRGSARLAWGDAQGALTDSRTASRLSPHYADAPKLWVTLSPGRAAGKTP
ncbi:MAG TPA: hypothetical protein VII63_06445 [Caulobacteraceae bacterium]